MTDDDADSSNGAAARDRDQIIDALDDAIAECQRKIKSGRMTDADRERARQGWHQTLAKLANAYRLLSKDKQLDEMAERIDALEEDLPDDTADRYRLK